MILQSVVILNQIKCFWLTYLFLCYNSDYLRYLILKKARNYFPAKMCKAHIWPSYQQLFYIQSLKPTSCPL